MPMNSRCRPAALLTTPVRRSGQRSSRLVWIDASTLLRITHVRHWPIVSVDEGYRCGPCWRDEQHWQYCSSGYRRGYEWYYKLASVYHFLSHFYRVSFHFSSFLPLQPIFLRAPLPFRSSSVSLSGLFVLHSMHTRIVFRLRTGAVRSGKQPNQEAREDSTKGRARESWSSVGIGSFG